jgi:hypothetical protein
VANSSAVVALDDILASQYNNLRLDVLDTTSGHLHNGTDARLHTSFGIGTAPAAATAVLVRGASLVSGVTQYGVLCDITSTSGATTSQRAFNGQIITSAASYTVTNAYTFRAETPSLGAASAIAAQFGFYAANQGATGVTNAYGLYVEATSGAATINYGAYFAGGAPAIYVAAGGMQIASGNLGVGGAPSVNVGIRLSGSVMSTSVDQYGVFSDAIASSAATTLGYAVFGRVRTAVASYTMGEARALVAENPIKGAGSTITNASGVYVASQTAGGTNNYGIYVEAPSGGGGVNYGIYVAGGAPAIQVAAGGIVITGSSRVTGGTLFLGTAGSSLGVLSFNGNTSGTITMQSAAAAGTWTFTLPPDDGDAGEQLQTNGSGVTTWEAAASLREFKHVGNRLDPHLALSRILAAPVSLFQYRRSTPGRRVTSTGDHETVYAGVMADEAPWAMHHGGRIFSPVSAFGYSAAAIVALHQRIASLEQRLTQRLTKN